MKMKDREPAYVKILNQQPQSNMKYELYDKEIILTGAEYHALCKILESINKAFLEERAKTKTLRKEYHIEPCFYFNKEDGDIRNFHDMVHAVYDAEELE